MLFHENKEKHIQMELCVNFRITPSEVKTFIRFDYDGDGKISDNEVQVLNAILLLFKLGPFTCVF